MQSSILTKPLVRLAFFGSLGLAFTSALTGSVITVPGGGDLQQAIDSAVSGDTIALQPGATYRGNFRLRKKNGDAYITIVTADQHTIPPEGTRIKPAQAAALPKVVSPNASPAIATDDGAHHYRLIGLEVSGPPGVYAWEIITLGSAAATDASALATDIELDRLYIHGDPHVGGKRGVALNSRATRIRNCWIADFKSTTQDTQAIGGWNGPGPYDIINNYLEGAADSILFGGAVPKIPGLVPSDIVIRRNHFSKPLSWRNGDPSYAGTPWLVEDLLQLKNARRVLVEGNIFEQNWDYSDNGGFPIGFTVRAEQGKVPWAVIEDVKFVRNIVRKAGAGVVIIGRDGNSNFMGRTRNVLVKDNLFHDLNRNAWGGGGEIFQVITGAEDVTFDHNTCIQQNGLNVLMFDGQPSARVTFTNNIAPNGAYGVAGSGKGIGIAALSYYAPGWVFRRNAIAGADGPKYPPDNFFPPDLNAVGFAAMAGDDFHLTPESLYRNAGTDQLDVGASVDEVLAATAGVLEGVPPGGEAPTAVSVSPSSGGGLSQVFRFKYADENDFRNIAAADALINATLSAVNGCHIQVRPGENRAWLRADDDSAWMGPLTLGSAGVLNNSQCTLEGTSSAATGSGTALSVSLSLTFTAAFGGGKNIYMYAADVEGLNSGWQLRGAWQPEMNRPPAALSVTPASGLGSSQTFQFLYSDGNGAADLTQVSALFNNSTGQARACSVQFKPADRSLRLRNDAGTGWIGPLTIGSPGLLRNTRCAVNAAGSSASSSGNSLVLGLAISFTHTFAGAKNTYLSGTDQGGKRTGWQRRGTWTVP